MKSTKTLLSLLLLTGCAAKQSSEDAATRNEQRQQSGDSSTRDDEKNSGANKSEHTVAAANSTDSTKQGTIVSAGGYLYGYETNPWFLANTKVVKYCVDIDEENFGASGEVARESITSAIAAWREVLAEASYEHQELKLGTQTFTEVTCETRDIDLRFQLGKLSNSQLDHIGNPVNFIGDTIEESYDEINMRGRGFIYIAPDKGPLRPQQKNLSRHFWNCNPDLNLTYVIAHELGHIFGFSHSPLNAFGMPSIMSESFPQRLLTESTYRADIGLYQASIDIGADNSRPYLGLKLSIRKLMGLKYISYGTINNEARGVIRTGDNEIPLLIHDQIANPAIGRGTPLGAFNFVAVNYPDYLKTTLLPGNTPQVSKPLGTFTPQAHTYSNSSIVSVKVPANQKALTNGDVKDLAKLNPNDMFQVFTPRLIGYTGVYESADKATAIPTMIKLISPTEWEIYAFINGKFQSIRTLPWHY